MQAAMPDTPGSEVVRPASAAVDPSGPHLLSGPVLTTSAAAAYCAIAEQTLRNLMHEGRGPHRFKQGRKNAFYPADLDEWLATRLTEPSERSGRDG